MNCLKFILILSFLIASLNSNSQTSLSNWKSYSISQNNSLINHEASLKAVNENEKLNLNAIEYKYYDRLEWINSTINSIIYVNSNRTIFGSEFFEPLFTSWDIYRDYYSQDTFDYQDLDVLSPK